MKIEEKVKNIIDNLRPYINQDGGDIEYVEIKDGFVYVRLLGSCVNCGLVDMTIKGGVEQIIIEEVPEIKGVEITL